MEISQKSLMDDIRILLTKFSFSDENRVDEDYLYSKINQTRAQFIVERFKVTNVIDKSWRQDLSKTTFHRVNFADDVTISSCDCDIYKAFIPQLVSLEQGNGNQDLGLNVISACGKTKYYPYDISMWKDIPVDHERNLFPYFDRINTSLYVKPPRGQANLIAQLRLYGVLQNPEDGKLISSTPIASGSIVLNTVYRVKYGQVIYAGGVYAANSTFTGTATTTFTGNGIVYLNAQVIAYRDTDPYPVTGEMARQIVYDILVKEFNVEKQALVDVKNDNRDDATKGQ